MGRYSRSRSNFSDAFDMYEEEAIDDDVSGSKNYRKRGLENTSSNHGWYICTKCGKSFRKGDMDIDHIVPQSKGGGSSRSNLQCICKHCNRSKQDDMTDTYTDLKRRKKEIEKQNKEDNNFLKSIF